MPAVKLTNLSLTPHLPVGRCWASHIRVMAPIKTELGSWLSKESEGYLCILYMAAERALIFKPGLISGCYYRLCAVGA